MTAQQPAAGAQPDGAMDEQSAARNVRQMFNSIAPRYDLLNHLLSANIDRLWWWRAARTFRTVLAQPDAVVVDLCCGTGDMTMALLRRRPPQARPILAADFAHEMLRRGAAKFSGRGAIAIEADALRLPLRNATVDLIVTAFGFRNLANYSQGLQEFARVLRPGGQLGILDFSEPNGALGKAYQWYFRCAVPAIGKAVYGQSGPYEYLPESVRRFPAPQQFVAQIESAGFEDARWTPYTLGIAGLYSAKRRGTTPADCAQINAAGKFEPGSLA